ncbi:hypothetical protein [Stenotrophomonas maltophilia]|uniref:hypothetical protein n=1 Tax=Stenotrophomonas maltophilia TaxID=40324 RepID=UPI0015DE470C|nr:hypothetical protein [Stenotrophomonas maltophilia]MBA0446895.1 hypothetical protein [Stenotrophomonas maltophilia]
MYRHALLITAASIISPVGMQPVRADDRLPADPPSAWTLVRKGDTDESAGRCAVFPRAPSRPFPYFIFEPGLAPTISVSFSEVGNTEIGVQVDAHSEASDRRIILDRDTAVIVEQIRAGGQRITARDSVARNTFSTQGLLPLLDACATQATP